MSKLGFVTALSLFLLTSLVVQFVQAETFFSDRLSRNEQCSDQADALHLHNEERRSFRAACKQRNGADYQDERIQIAAKPEFEAGIGPTIHERCHMDNCNFATLQSSAPIARLKAGVLFAISGLQWGAEYAQREDDHEYDVPPKSIGSKSSFIWMVFCSKSRPMMFYFDDASWSAKYLRPGDDQAASGADESAYADYWASCHHFFPKDEALVAKMAPRLGYHFHGGWPDGNPPETIKQPSDLMH